MNIYFSNHDRFWSIPYTLPIQVMKVSDSWEAPAEFHYCEIERRGVEMFTNHECRLGHHLTVWWPKTSADMK